MLLRLVLRTQSRSAKMRGGIGVNQTRSSRFDDYQIFKLSDYQIGNGKEGNGAQQSARPTNGLGMDFTILSALSDIFVKAIQICPQRRYKVEPAGSTPHPGPLPGRGGEGKAVAPSGYALVLRPFSSAGYSQPNGELAAKGLMGSLGGVSREGPRRGRIPINGIGTLRGGERRTRGWMMEDGGWQRPQMDADGRGLGRIRIFNRRELRERRRGRRLQPRMDAN